MEWQYYDCVKLVKVYKEIEMYYNQYNELRLSNEFILEVLEEGLGLLKMLPSLKCPYFPFLMQALLVEDLFK